MVELVFPNFINTIIKKSILYILTFLVTIIYLIINKKITF